MRSHLHKRSLTLAGHQTSLALEPAFWRVLEAAAAARGQSLAALLSAIDQDRPEAQPLASAARVFALREAGRSLAQPAPP